MLRSLGTLSNSWLTNPKAPGAFQGPAGPLMGFLPGGFRASYRPQVLVAPRVGSEAAPPPCNLRQSCGLGFRVIQFLGFRV